MKFAELDRLATLERTEAVVASLTGHLRVRIGD
jgi:hypothetical protein